MNLNNLPPYCYLDKTKKVIKYVPEEEVKMQEFNEKTWKLKFPQDINQNLKLNKLLLTNIGVYSIATPAISNSLIEVIQNSYKYYNLDIKKLTITETNGGLGGFSIRLAQHFDNINIVEINPDHVKIIKNNLHVYNLDSKKKDIKIYENDYLDVMYNIKSDVIVCDPPWGGYSYSKQKNMRLGINNINIVCIINELIRNKLFKLFILMAPKNYDIKDFITNIKSKNINIKKLEKHYLISVNEM